MRWWRGKPSLPCAMFRIGGLVMTSKVSAAFVMSVGVALALLSSETFGASATAPAPASPSTHTPFVRPLTRTHDHRIGRNIGPFRPLVGSPFWGPWNGQRDLELAQPVAGDRNYNFTYKFDVPWDWAHRYPPSFFESPAMPSPPPSPVFYNPGCPAQTVTVPSASGAQQTVSIIRC
jgi:hypothetical protein